MTDAGMKHLHSLWLSSTAVTDASLKEVAKLKSLRWLWLDGTSVTDAGRQRLRKALPGLEVMDWPPALYHNSGARRPC